MSFLRKLSGSGRPNVATLTKNNDIDGLIEALKYHNDKESDYYGLSVVLEAVRALGQVGDSHAIEPLRETLNRIDNSEKVVKSGIEALQIGILPQTKEKIKHLEQNLELMQQVREETYRAIKKLEPVPQPPFPGKTLILELTSHGETSIDAEAGDLSSSFVAMKAMGHASEELLPLILENLFNRLRTKAIFLTDSVQSAIEAEDSKVTMIVRLDSATDTDKAAIEQAVNQENYQPHKDDPFFKTLLHLPVACYWRTPSHARNERATLFDSSRF